VSAQRSCHSLLEDVAPAFAIVLAAVIHSAGCMNVGGKLRPIWRAPWSEVHCRPAEAAQRQSLEVTVSFDSGELLPGATVSAHRAGSQRSAATHKHDAVTDERGEAALWLFEGAWVIRAELAGFHGSSGPSESPRLTGVECSCIRFSTRSQSIKAGSASLP
jgi:hypothetical protein